MNYKMSPSKQEFKPFRPIYKISKRDRTIDLGTRKLILKLDGEQEESDARVYIKTIPSMKLEMTLNTGLSSPKLFNAFTEKVGINFKLPGAILESDLNIVGFHTGTEGTRLTLSPSTQPVTIGSFADVVEVRFHIVNFVDFVSPNAFAYKKPHGGLTRGEQITLQWNGYNIEIISLPQTGAIIDNLERNGGRDITHTGRICAVDGSVLDSDKVNEIFRMLHDFLSFAMGSWTSSLLPVGLNRSGQPTWESWGIRRIDPWKRNQTWFDPHHGELLTQIFPGFAARSSETIWSEAISLSIYWYIFSNSRSAAADGSIVLAQAALELLSWVYITEHKKSLSKEGMEKLSASDKFSILLSICGIPIEIPTNFTHLIAYAKAFNHMNGPKVITAVRNVLVYPDIKARGRKKGFDHGVGHPLLLLCNAKAPNY